ncbi:NADH-quinone oxidoreductase subunit NuoK [Brevibacillus dissolubilis]|uniref:NADH-quinone oxidoreductase subunit NuoK n=1 Tax=Brevibacillus dissolubilis TaxID=1844116 RepID=UPI001117A320|nr:NADH-quinone oxidoreductase subunit NuoK [Brevibacillus dissolubilis]
MTVTLSSYLLVALILFCVGLYGALRKRNAIIVLLSIELMLNAVNINLVAFSKFGLNAAVTGQIFTLFTMTVAAAEVAVGIAILLAMFRNRDSIHVDEMDSMKR